MFKDSGSDFTLQARDLATRTKQLLNYCELVFQTNPNHKIPGI